MYKQEYQGLLKSLWAMMENIKVPTPSQNFLAIAPPPGLGKTAKAGEDGH
jgi:hypothetical protein